MTTAAPPRAVTARRVVELVAHPGTFTPGHTSDTGDPGALLPRGPSREYDVRPLVNRLLDLRFGGPPLDELQPLTAPNMVIGLGRLGGRTVGVVANNPLRDGGRLDPPAVAKACRFARMCDAFRIPLVVVVDPPGVGPEFRDVFAGVSVPRVTLVTRTSYGGGYTAMNSRSLGATAVFAWPDAEQLTESGGLRRAIAPGVVDEIVESGCTRERLVRALAEAPARRGHHDDPPQ